MPARPDRRTAPGFTPELGERIQQAIAALGGLMAASRILGRTKDTLAKWRDGGSKISLHDLTELASAAGLDPVWLAFGKTEHASAPECAPLSATHEAWDLWMPVILRLNEKPSPDALREQFAAAVIGGRTGARGTRRSNPSPVSSHAHDSSHAHIRPRIGGTRTATEIASLLAPQPATDFTIRPLTIDEWSDRLVRDSVKWLAHGRSDAISFLATAAGFSSSIMIVEFDRNGRNGQVVSASIVAESDRTGELLRSALPTLAYDERPRGIALSSREVAEPLQFLLLPLPTGDQRFAAVVF